MSEPELTPWFQTGFSDNRPSRDGWYDTYRTLYGEIRLYWKTKPGNFYASPDSHVGLGIGRQWRGLVKEPK